VAIDLAGLDDNRSRLQILRQKTFLLAFLKDHSATECSMLRYALPSADLLFWLLTTKSGSFIQAAMFFPKLIQALALFWFRLIAVT